MPFSYICAIILVNKRCSDASNERQRHNQTQHVSLDFCRSAVSDRCVIAAYARSAAQGENGIHQVL